MGERVLHHMSRHRCHTAWRGAHCVLRHREDRGAVRRYRSGTSL